MYQKWKKVLTEKSGIALDKKDAIILAILVLCYGILSFWNLGSFTNPQTFLTNSSSTSDSVLKLSSSAPSSLVLRYFVGPKSGVYQILGSSDNEDYRVLGLTQQDDYVFAWYDVTLFNTKGIRYLKFHAITSDASLGEVGIPNQNITLTATRKQDQVLVDEKSKVPSEISYLNSSYFDEVYFARAAYEYAHGIPTYEWVHPPFGKLVEAIPVRLFGMTPFNYRVVSNIAGILLLVVLYAFGKALFKKRGYALLTSLLMALDGFHFAQTRIGTVDSQLVLYILSSYYFMYRYLILPKGAKLSRKFFFLGFSGLMISFAIATKWTGLFAGLGLAILFFLHFYTTYQGKKDAPVGMRILGYCVLVFVVLPVTIYASSYFLFPRVSSYHVSNFNELISITKGMYEYHSTLDATHDFSSNWYTWPILLKPVWFYSNGATGYRSTISTVGNPAVWWASFIAIFWCFTLACHKDKRSIFLLVAFTCLFLPYTVIGRCMFLYHYFPAFPFAILMLVYVCKQIQGKLRFFLPNYLFLVFLLFLYFYPAVSGLTVSETWLSSMKWLPTWYF